MENYHHHHQWQLRQQQFQQRHPLFSFQDNIQELQQQFQQQLELQFQQQHHSQQLMQQQQFQQEQQQDHSQQQFQEQRPLYPLQQQFQQEQQDHSQQQFQGQHPLYPSYFQDHIHIQKVQQQFQQEEEQQQDHSRHLMHQQFQQEQQDHSRQLLMQQEFQQKQQLMQQQFQQKQQDLLVREQHQSYFTDHPFQQQHPFYFPNHPPQPLTLLQPQAHHQEQGVLNNFPNRVLVFNDSAYYPPGYRFCPTDEELVSEYLIKSKHDHEQQPSSSRQRRIHRIHEVDIYKENPESLTRQYPLSDADMKDKWYFLTPLERKYPKGNRPSRKCVGTGPEGYWKPTGKDTEIKVGDVVAKKKFLDFMEGTTPAGRKTDWKMHEYRIVNDDSTPKNGDQHKEKLRLVLCRIYVNTRKKDKEDEGSSSRDDDESI